MFKVYLLQQRKNSIRTKKLFRHSNKLNLSNRLTKRRRKRGRWHKTRRRFRQSDRKW